VGERVPGGFVEIAVEPEHGERGDRRGRERVAEPSLEETHTVVEQSVAIEVPPHLLERDGELGHAGEIETAILRVDGRVRRRQAAERIRDPDRTIVVTVRGEDRAHQNRDATAPDAGLDQVAGHAIVEHALDAELHVVEALEARHRVPRLAPLADEVAAPGPALVPRILAEREALAAEMDPVRQTALHELEIELARVRGRGATVDRRESGARHGS
jgi:hypothetical protein